MKVIALRGRVELISSVHTLSLSLFICLMWLLHGLSRTQKRPATPHGAHPSMTESAPSDERRAITRKVAIGFTLALLGFLLTGWVVMTVCQPALKAYRQRAIITQGVMHLDQIAQGVALQYSTRDQERRCGVLPESNEWTPSGSNCEGDDSKFIYLEQDWADPSWVLLDFNPQVPTYFSYRVQRNAHEIVLEAKSQPLCDGEEVLIRRVLIASQDDLCAINATAQVEVQGPED